jgi:uncharacterized surface protein with fasciclin (FAS1) repeats
MLISIGKDDIMPNLSRRLVVGGAFAGAALLAPMKMLRARSLVSPLDAWTVIESDPRFSDAVELFKYAGLVDYVRTTNFTAFLPTNAAFDKVPDVLSKLLQGRSRPFPETTLTVDFVRAHAVYDIHPLSEFSGRNVVLRSIAGYPIQIDGTKAGHYTVRWTSISSKIGTAQLMDNPVIASNALIYPVDTVILTAS